MGLDRACPRSQILPPSSQPPNAPDVRSSLLEYNAIFQREREGGYSVWVPSLPGCASQGETFEQALENIQEAITLYLEDTADVREATQDRADHIQRNVTLIRWGLRRT